MSTFLLIHGMWHGGWCWERLTPLLRDAGHNVHAPTLAGLAERANMHSDDIDLNTHVQEIVDLCESQNLRDVILVGHSSGGFMAHVVADRIPERVAHIVNLDGMIPENGKAFKEMMPDYWSDFKNRASTSGDEWWVPPRSRMDVRSHWRGLGVGAIQINPASAENVDDCRQPLEPCRAIHSAHIHPLHRGVFRG